jgi:hypothetical protein
LDAQLGESAARTLAAAPRRCLAASTGQVVGCCGTRSRLLRAGRLVEVLRELPSSCSGELRAMGGILEQESQMHGAPLPAQVREIVVGWAADGSSPRSLPSSCSGGLRCDERHRRAYAQIPVVGFLLHKSDAWSRVPCCIFVLSPKTRNSTVQSARRTPKRRAARSST